MKRISVTRFASSIFITLIFLSASSSAKAAEEWNPKRTWAFFVCLVEWKDKETFSSFPKNNRKDTVLRDTLKARGVPAEQIVYLQDSAAKTAVVEQKFAEFLKKPAPGDWVFVYFEGHGYKTDDGVPYLATYDVNESIKGWKFDTVPDAIEQNFKGSHAIIALDNCYSGAMADAVRRKPRRISYGVLASSLASQLSTSNWTFTESLISAFNGASFVDKDRDGTITFAELGENSKEDMLFGEEQVATIAFTGKFDPQIVLSKAESSTSNRVGERVEAYSVDGWYRGFIVDSKGGKQKVHYYGYETTDDEWVTEDKIRRSKTVQYAKGTTVEVEWKGDWYKATVLAVKGGSHFVTYIGYGKEWDEWVSSKRIRKLNFSDLP
ncbi:MAG TPA: Tudor-knot domain-containing protein [Pyrinomonadaceae bacterium]|nr:Tudor-knot domain-containing protein [Pyrinomonadaceae bacterium]